MGLLDSTQESTDQALSVMASQPLEPEKPKAKNSAWSVIPRAIAAAGAETAANLGDVSVAAQRKVAAPMFASGDPIRDIQSTEGFINAAGPLEQDTSADVFRNQGSGDLYSVAQNLRPDPITAGKAEQVVFGLTKGLTKAVGAGVALGPVGGAVAFGASEGMTTAEDLAREGVDLATRTKVGAVTGALNAAGMALPVAGNTLAKTVALGAAGGPASFIAQQQATRSILENADYGAIAQQYDPLDPVGLAIATLLPAGFGAWAMRGARTARAAVTDAVASNPGEVAPAARESMAAATPDDIDAAMVHNLTIARDAHESATGQMEFLPGKVENSNREKIDGFTATFDNTKGGSGYIELAVDGDRIYPTMVDNGLFRIGETTGGAVSGVYEQAIEFAARNGKSFTSDDSVTVTASRVYESLSRKGYEVQKNPAARLATSPEVLTDRFVTDDKSPVFSVVQRPAAEATPSVKDPHIASILDRAEVLKTEQPDLPVAIREDGTLATASEEIAAIRRQAREGTDTDFGADDAPLLLVAAECFLSLGA